MAHYITAGGTGPAVVLCHGGIPGSSGTAGWRYQTPFLGQRGFRVFAPDFPGYGLSDNRPEYHPRKGRLDHLEFLRMFVDALGLDQFHLSGNSMGCANTWAFVVNYPWRVKSYILIAGSVGDLVPPEKTVRGNLDVRKINRETFDGTADSMRRMLEPIIYRNDGLPQELLEMRTRPRTGSGSRCACCKMPTRPCRRTRTWAKCSRPRTASTS